MGIVVDNITPEDLTLFSTLEARERKELDQTLARTLRTVEREARIATRGDRMDSLLILLVGRAHAEIIDGSGHVMVVETFAGPEVIASALLFGPGRRVAFLAGRLRMSQFASLRQKIAVYIADLRTRTNNAGTEYVVFPHSRQELADLFGVARPSLSRELGRLDDEGILQIDGNRAEILDRAAISALVSGCE